MKNIPKGTFVSQVKYESKKQQQKIRAALQNRWRGPYRVSKVISELSLICVINGREQVMAYKNIKPYIQKVEARSLAVKMLVDLY